MVGLAVVLFALARGRGGFSDGCRAEGPFLGFPKGKSAKLEAAEVVQKPGFVSSPRVLEKGAR
jgi:hypothetical protein